MEQEKTFFDLTPTPELLQLIGKIPFRGWQCIAELLDNSIDALINIDSSISHKKIQVHIPRPNGIRNNEPVIIEDWGVGMTEDQLESAVRAGYSNKTSGRSLGLFGMGFNVATAKIADVVEVYTSTKDMDKEIGVRIDLVEMSRSNSFIRPRLQKEKSFKASGTTIKIYNYKPNAEQLLKTREIIENIRTTYSNLLFSEHKIEIIINNEPIKPFKFCAWNNNRFVVHKGEEIPAIIPIDQKIAEEYFCERCLYWLGASIENATAVICPRCNLSDKVINKVINIHGWVGVQRYNDMNHFGINIIRNGRVISKLDKSFFTWKDKKGDHEDLFEYPIDQTFAGGRLIGEIEANFIIPEYTKDNFRRDDPQWIQAYEFIRGIGPFQPEISAKYGYRKNKSPLGLLFQGFRYSKPPGKRTLTMGNKDGGNDYKTPANWADLFYEGKDPEYQDDKKWWQAVLDSEIVETGSTNDPTDLNRFKKNGGTSPWVPPIKKGEDELPGKRFPRGKPTLYNLEKELGLKPIGVTLVDYTPLNDNPLPIIFQNVGQNQYLVNINIKHKLFRDFADGYEDLVMMEVASKFSALKGDPVNWPISRVYYELKSKYLKEKMLDVDLLKSSANGLMREIHSFLTADSGILLPHKPSLTEDQIKKIKQDYLNREHKQINSFDLFLKTSTYVKYCDLLYLFDFIREFPELIYDDNLFDLPYSPVDAEFKSSIAEKYNSYFSDVKWFMTELSNAGEDKIKDLKNDIIRNRFSLDILYAHRKK